MSSPLSWSRLCFSPTDIDINNTQVKSASFMAHAVFERIMHRILPEQDDLRNSVLDRTFGPWVTPLNTVIRYCIVCEGVFLGGMQELPFLESYLRENGKKIDLGEMRSTTKGRLLSRRLQEGYERALMSHVGEGNRKSFLVLTDTSTADDVYCRY